MKYLVMSLVLVLSMSSVHAKSKKTKAHKMSHDEAKDFCMTKVEDSNNVKKINKCVKKAMKKGKF